MLNVSHSPSARWPDARGEAGAGEYTAPEAGAAWGHPGEDSLYLF